MTTSFSALPIVNLGLLRQDDSFVSEEAHAALGKQLYDVFATTGFAYLSNCPLSFSHEDVFALARDFFTLSQEEKMKLAKQNFQPQNANTYRGYFPTQPLNQADNLKEGFEMGPANLRSMECRLPRSFQSNLSEANVWPESSAPSFRPQLEQLYAELQALSSKLLSLLATSLGRSKDYFAPYLTDSLSTLRLLHYPPRHPSPNEQPTSEGGVKLSCTPHTDSGILTLLHQDSTGGLEVLNSSGQWISAPYIPGTLVVNIGDLMAEVSGGRFVATMHRVRAPSVQRGGEAEPFGRFSVPFFFEPGETCLVRSVDDDDGVGDAANTGLIYGQHVQEKMKTWVEFQNQNHDQLPMQLQDRSIQVL